MAAGVLAGVGAGWIVLRFAAVSQRAALMVGAMTGIVVAAVVIALVRTRGKGVRR